jgi:hypothetical protein
VVGLPLCAAVWCVQLVAGLPLCAAVWCVQLVACLPLCAAVWCVQLVAGLPLCAAVWCVQLVAGLSLCAAVVCAPGGRRTAVCCGVVCAVVGRLATVCCSVVCAAGGRLAAMCLRLSSTVCGARGQPAFLKWCKESACVVRESYSGNCVSAGVAEQQNMRDTPTVVVGLWCVPVCHHVAERFSHSVFAENSEAKHILTCQSRLFFCEL